MNSQRELTHRSHTTPAVLVIPIESVDPDYHAWIEAQTQAAQ